MNGLATVGGGSHSPHNQHHHHRPHGHADLSPAEHQAATDALARLSVGTSGQTPTFGAGGLNVTVSGSFSVKSLLGSHGLVSGQGSDTFAGGVSSTGLSLGGYASDTVVGGSGTVHGVAVGAAASHFHLSADTINVSGSTAASVKAVDTPPAVSGGLTLTLGDKTTVTISGVHTHDIIRPH